MRINILPLVLGLSCASVQSYYSEPVVTFHPNSYSPTRDDLFRRHGEVKYLHCQCTFSEDYYDEETTPRLVWSFLNCYTPKQGEEIWISNTSHVLEEKKGEIKSFCE